MTSPSAPEVRGELPLETPAVRDTGAADLAKVVATAELEHGGVVTFLDLGDGRIGIAETVPMEADFVSPAMIENLNTTPLEVYLALRAGNADVPAALLRDHQRMARSRNATLTPRVLARPSSSIVGGGYAAGYGCASPGNSWIAYWNAEFAGVTKYREADYFTENSAGKTFYPGAPVYYGTNTNSKTYLGACNGDALYDVWMEVHRRIGGKWVGLYGVWLLHDSKYTFYSGFPASYRAVVTPLVDGTLIEDFGIGAAWTLSPPVASP